MSNDRKLFLKDGHESERRSAGFWIYRLELDVNALKRSLNTCFKEGMELGVCIYFMVKIYIQSKLISVSSAQLQAL